MAKRQAKAKTEVKEEKKAVKREIKDLFELGEIIILGEANEIIVESKLVFQNLIAKNLHFYSLGKWGKVDGKTAWKNDMNVKSGEGKIIGLYETPFGKIEISTNYKRTFTEIKMA